MKIVSGFIGSAYAYAAKKAKQHEYGLTIAIPFSGLPAASDKDKYISRTSHSLDAGHSSWTIGSSNSIPTKEVYVWTEICNK